MITIMTTITIMPATATTKTMMVIMMMIVVVMMKMMMLMITVGGQGKYEMVTRPGKKVKSTLALQRSD